MLFTNLTSHGSSLLERLRILAPGLRTSALYNLFLLALAVGTFRAGIIMKPTINAAAEAQAMLDYYTTLSYMDVAPTPHALVVQHSLAVSKSTERYKQAWKANAMALVSFSLWAMALALGSRVHVPAGVTTILSLTFLSLALLGVVMAYWDELVTVRNDLLHELTRLLTEPFYLRGKWGVVLGVILCAATWDIYRRHRRTTLPN